ncbi:MAG TPA: aminotransferase class I/II-fold pyridoxal phosphate-dependent enzyme, partial [Vicinamibacteria bacterium]|nr:aminotransferase class I/II-fold pyridoxal phosphate-dependent enzyme [Vicinamibacteria bacterium]
PIQPDESASRVCSLFREEVPEAGAPPAEVLNEFQRRIVPFATDLQHPGNFGYIPNSTGVVGIVADLLASTLNQNVSLVRGGASAAAVEDQVVRWLRSFLGLSGDGGGVLTSGGSIANLMGLALAREKAPSRHGLVFYVSDEVHSSIERGLRFLGLAPADLRRLPADDSFHLDPSALREAVERDRGRGLTPAAVVATAGTIGSGAVDPLEDLAEVCRELGLWLHVDGAYGAIAAAAPSGAFLRAGLDLADSLSLDPHKWLFVPIDTSCLLVKDVLSMRRFLTLVPEYLKVGAADGEVPQPMESTIELSRRFRALRLWMSFKVYGARAIRARIEEHLGLARKLAAWIEADPRFELSAKVETSTVAFRHVPAKALSPLELDGVNEALFDRVTREPGLFLSRNRLRGRFTLRACITGLRTREEDVRRLWDACLRAASETQ